MRFMLLMIPKDYGSAKPGALPSKEMVEAMGKFNESMVKAGVVLSLDGLHPPATGTRIKFTGGKPVRTDGPFTEAKELLGGYWMIQVKSKEEAVQWAMRCPALEGDMIEVRQVQELSDFPPEIQAVAGVKDLGLQ